MGRLIRRLLAAISLTMGAQVLLPPCFVANSSAVSSPVSSWAAGFFQQSVQAAPLEDIRDRGYLIVAVKNNRTPMGFIDEAGNLSGFEIDIARQLALELLGDAEAIRLVPVSNVERLNAVMEDRVDIAIASLTLTEPRRRLVNFSDPYYLDGTAFVVRTSNNQAESQQHLQAAPQSTSQATSQSTSQSSPLVMPQGIPLTLSDLRLSEVALLNRSSTVAHVRYILPGARLISVTSYQQGQALLQDNLVDAFAGDASVLAGWLRQSEDTTQYALLPEVISAEPLAIALPKGQQYDTLQDAVNQTIRTWYAQEWLQERAALWGLPSGILPSLVTSPAADE